MGNRSKYVAVTAAAAGAALIAGRRRARWRRAFEGIRDATLPTHVTDLPTDRQSGIDEAHAPGHRHLPPIDRGERAPSRPRGRPWTKHAHGIRHPVSGK
jgi:hypothetical protein